MMRFLIREGILKDVDPEIMAAQFSSPITVWINLCDREPDREDEVKELVRKLGFCQAVTGFAAWMLLRREEKNEKQLLTLTLWQVLSLM